MASKKGQQQSESLRRLQEERRKFREAVEPILYQQLAETIDNETDYAVVVPHSDMRLLVVRGEDYVQVEKKAAAGTRLGLKDISLPPEWFDGHQVTLMVGASEYGQLTLCTSDLAVPLKLELTANDGTRELIVLTPGVATATHIRGEKLATIDVL